jgi:hypothetical protein
VRRTADESKSPSPSPSESPSPSPSESPNGKRGAGGSSRGSSPATSAFIADPGPDFDPKRSPGPEPPPAPEEATIHALPEAPPGWEVETVRDILTAQGQAAHAVFGVGEEDWAYTEGDLVSISRPLTRILNRYDATRAAAGTGDEIAVVIGFGGYIGRSYAERKAVLDALRAQAEAAPEPITGVAAEPGTGPPEPGPEDRAGVEEEPEPPPGVSWKV